MTRKSSSVSSPPRSLLTKRQVADHLGVSERTVSRHIASGVLRAIPLGRLVRIDPDDLRDFLRERSQSMSRRGL